MTKDVNQGHANKAQALALLFAVAGLMIWLGLGGNPLIGGGLFLILWFALYVALYSMMREGT